MINLEKKFKKEFNTSPTLRKGMEGQKKQWQKKKKKPTKKDPGTRAWPRFSSAFELKKHRPTCLG
jgi:hypothetical protein